MVLVLYPQLYARVTSPRALLTHHTGPQAQPKKPGAGGY
jgi:hypothetical protein